MTGLGSRAFTVGGVVRRTIALLDRDLPAFVGLALALSLLPQLALVGLISTMAGSDAGTEAVGGLVGLMAFLSVTRRGAVVALALPDPANPDGARRSVGAALLRGAVRCVPNGAILVLFWLAVCLAGLLLVVPGVLLLCRWIAALPAEVAEGAGVRGAFARSRDLTAGHRWRILGLLSLYAVPAGFEPFLMLFQNPDGPASAKAGAAAVAALVGSAIGMVGEVGVAAIYAELRALRDGAEPPEIAEAFG